MKRQKISAILLRIAVYLASLITVGALLFVVGYILVKGVPNLSWKLFEWKYTTDNLSLLPALLNTILMTGLSLLIAVPLGVFAAIYLVEYAKRGSRPAATCRCAAPETESASRLRQCPLFPKTSEKATGPGEKWRGRPE